MLFFFFLFLRTNSIVSAKIESFRCGHSLVGCCRFAWGDFILICCLLHRSIAFVMLCESVDLFIRRTQNITYFAIRQPQKRSCLMPDNRYDEDCKKSLVALHRSASHEHSFAAITEYPHAHLLNLLKLLTGRFLLPGRLSRVSAICV